MCEHKALHWKQGQQRTSCWCCCVVCISSQLVPNYALWLPTSQRGWTWGQMPFHVIMLTYPPLPHSVQPSQQQYPRHWWICFYTPAQTGPHPTWGWCSSLLWQRSGPVNSPIVCISQTVLHLILPCSHVHPPTTDWTITVHVCGLFSQPRPQVSNAKVLPGSVSVSGQTNTTLCLVAVILAYLAVRPSPQGPLFVFQNGSYLTRDKLVVHVRQGVNQTIVFPLRIMKVQHYCTW